MRRFLICLLVLVCLALLITSVSARGFVSNKMWRLIGWYDATAQTFYTISNPSIPAMSFTIDRRLLPSDMPTCGQGQLSTVKEFCPLIVVTIYSEWQRFEGQ